MRALYKAKSLSGAQARARRLEKQVTECHELLKRFDDERKLLAMMAADTPQFQNPLVAAKARRILDRILSSPF